MTPRRIAVARIWQEANTFNPIPATLADFRLREWVTGDQVPAAARGTATELGGLMRFLDDRPEWQVTFSRCTSAPPGGPVEQPALEAITAEILADLGNGPWDGVYISLHGAMVATGDLAPDYSFLAAVRQVIGSDPVLTVSLDLHACIDPALAEAADIVSAYHTYPHVDLDATALRCLTAMDRAFATGIRPRVALRALPFLPLSHGMRTDGGPMRELVDLAAAECRAQGFADVSMFGGFAYADTPNSHATVAITHLPGQDPAPALDRLGAAFLERRSRFAVSLPDARQALTEAIGALHAGMAGPVAIVDAADNPLSGGIGDTTGLFRALTDLRPDLPSVMCFFHDPDLVARAHDLGEGAAITCTLGGRITRDYGDPVPFSGVVARLTDGRFRNRGPMEYGREIVLGRTAVLQAGAMRVVITETCQSANDPGWCDLHGVDLSQVALFCVKAKNHFRAGFGDLCTRIVDVDCPGPAPVDTSGLRGQHGPPDWRRMS